MEIMLGFRLISLAGVALTALAPQSGYDLAYVGRDAIFIDAASVSRTGDTVSFRTLRVQDSQFTAGDAVFLGGFAQNQIDCRARTFRLTSFQSLKPDYSTGPDTPSRAQTYAIAGGSPEAAEAKALCDGERPYQVHVPDARAAVAQGRARLDAAD